MLVPNWASQASADTVESQGKGQNHATSKEVTRWLSFLSNKLTTPQMSESVDMPPSDCLIPVEFAAAMTAIKWKYWQLVISPWLSAFKHAFWDASAELPHVSTTFDRYLGRDASFFLSQLTVPPTKH